MDNNELKVLTADEYTKTQASRNESAEKVSATIQPAGGVMTPAELEAARDRHLAAFGVSHKTVETPATDKDGNPVLDENGNQVMTKQLVITKIPEETVKLMTFFTDDDNFECWFAGCEGLRAQYKADIEAAGGSGCPDCKRGAIIRKYMPLVREAVKNDEQAKNTTVSGTRPVGVPGSAESSGSGAPSSTGLLRRAASYLKKVFKPS